MNRSNISLLLPNLHGGGAERVSLDLAKEFHARGHRVEFVLMQSKGELLHEAHDQFSVVDLEARRIRSLPLSLAGYLRQHRPDALLAAMWPLTVIAPLAARMAGTYPRIVASEHVDFRYTTSHKPYERFVLRRFGTVLYGLSNHVVAVSDGVADSLTQAAGLARDQIKVIHNPISSPPISNDAALAAAEKLWSGPPGARIVTVGSFKAQKNHPLLLRAFAQIDRPDARLMFVGDGAGRAELLSLAQELDVADRVVLAGFQHDPAPFYRTADLFVLSSDFEGFGNVIVEALACGTPVVSTDCPSGPREILGEGRFGLLVPVGDDVAMALAIRQALDAPVSPDILVRRASDFAPHIAALAYLKLLLGKSA